MSATKKVVDGETSGSQRIRIILTTSKSVANLEKVFSGFLFGAFMQRH
jgi:hypothetical protein